jgi:acyl carrier protein
MDNLEKLNLLLSSILKIDMIYISDSTSPENTETWDSFNTLSMAIALEKEFNINLPLEEIIMIKTVKDIKQLLADKGVVIERSK